jgi:hypothetical protein
MKLHTKFGQPSLRGLRVTVIDHYARRGRKKRRFAFSHQSASLRITDQKRANIGVVGMIHDSMSVM